MPKNNLDKKKIEQNWNQRGFSFGIFVDPPGKVELEISGNSLLAPIGKEFLIPAGAIHSVRNKGKTHSRWHYGYKRT